ncbi:E3 ubiquitin-protein ligase RFWD3-like [Contarinia nasturtii]|uniref:E3 ubiquitin-protein ligase RFWD3-like n=1 Tax=Contarinia nasturtii TaxID=265458 RepID=UPI0012D3F36D|nr:E3 ubiquitin-protein ligase RFWD3-like [Contarinia nasturtii]
MDSEGSNETGNEAISEPIETSVISRHIEMIIVQPGEINAADNDLSINRNDQQVYVERLVNVENELVEVGPVESGNDADLTPNRKKRKRSQSRKSDSPKKAPPPRLNDDDDDGSTCSICLDSWESKGEHRLVSLKCGHLFGDSCIRRWIHECAPQAKCCPTCKNKAAPRDLRPLYAKRIVVADKSEEYRLQDLLEAEKSKNVELQSTLSAIKLELAVRNEEYSKLQIEFNKIKKFGIFNDAPQTSTHRDIMYKMAMLKNIDLNREGGCRAMTYGRRIKTLMVSQKSSVTLFQGYGVRFVRAHDFQPTLYFRISANPIRDLSLDTDEEFLAAASQDTNAYIYSVTNHNSITTITPSENQKIWATSFDKVRPRYLHIGSQQGITYIYDVRNCLAPVEELKTPGDLSPVIGIEPIPVSNEFRFGGFIVCKLTSLWFYEYTASERIEQTKLVVEGPFVSINFNEQNGLLLIATRLGRYPQARLIVARLTKIDQTTVLRVECTILGSRIQPKLVRSTQINIGNDSLVANYLQDMKTVSIWSSKNGTKMQGFNIDEDVLDMCPVYLDNSSYLATLSEHKCRIFQMNSV